MSDKKLRIKVTASEARAYKDKHFWDEVLRKLLAERNRIDRKIARLKKKIPTATMDGILEAKKQEERRKLGEATALITKALQEGKL